LTSGDKERGIQWERLIILNDVPLVLSVGILDPLIALIRGILFALIRILLP